MKKVLCIHDGNQINERKVKVGIIYTVLEVIEDYYGKKFYLLAECGNLCMYATRLFVELPEVKSEVMEEKITTIWNHI